MSGIFSSHVTDLIGPVRIERFRLKDGKFLDMVYDYSTGRHMVNQLFDACGEPINEDADDAYEALEKAAIEFVRASNKN